MPTHTVRSASLAHLLSSVSFIPLLAAGMAAPAKAQTTLELPGIVVEGATLEAPRPGPKRRPAATTPSAPNGASQQEGQVQDADESVAEAEAASNQIAAIPAAHLGTAVTVVTGDDLQRQQIRHAADALRSLPGVSVNRTGSPAGLTQVRIRGAEANHTLVLIDGIEANAGSSGEFDFSDLMIEDIERIEVIRGPQSALYGSNAIGGVVNIITKRRGGPLVTARAEGGSFGTKGGAARVSGGNERAWASATVEHQRSDGYNIAPEGLLGEDDGYRITSFSASAGAMLSNNIRLDLNIRRSDKHLDRDDETGFDSRFKNGGDWIIASDSFSRYSAAVLLMGASLRWDTLDGNLTHLFRISRNQTIRHDAIIADFDEEPWDGSGFGNGFGPPVVQITKDDSFKLSYLTTYRFSTPGIGARHAISGLVDFGQESFKNETDFGVVEASRKQTGFAGEWRGEFFERIFLSAGLRHDDNDSFENFTTWRGTASILFPEFGFRPHASVGTGVRAPSMMEQFGVNPFFIANADLKPEESKGWDIGLEFSFLGGKVIFDATYFSTSLVNLIDGKSNFEECPTHLGGGLCLKPVNVAGKSKREGIELTGRFRLTPSLNLGLTYTYLEALDGEGKPEVRRPNHAGRADLYYIFDDGRGELNLGVVYNGESVNQVFGAPSFFPVGRLTLDDYWLVSAAASYELNPGLEIYGRVENLLDQDYEEVFGFSTAGIAAYAGLRWTFDYQQLADGLTLK